MEANRQCDVCATWRTAVTDVANAGERPCRKANGMLVLYVIHKKTDWCEVKYHEHAHGGELPLRTCQTQAKCLGETYRDT